LERRHAEALTARDRALALNPNSTTALRSSGWVRANVGDGERAIADLERALRLNPLDPENAYVLCGMAFARLQLGQPEEALLLARRRISERPSFDPAHGAEAYALNACGRVAEAEQIRGRMRGLGRYPSVAEYERVSPWLSPAFRALTVDTMRRLGVLD
jgi:tetratricopeptide (TPR) repeat protein